MGRWGEDEKKTDNLGGFILWFAILVFTCYTFYHNYQNLETRGRVEKIMQSVIRVGTADSKEQMTAKIYDKIKEAELTLPEGSEIEVDKWKDNYGNWVVKCYIPFAIKIDLYVTDFKVRWDIKEEVVLVL